MRGSTLVELLDKEVIKELFIEERTNFGTHRNYPDCEVSKFLCKLKRVDTLTNTDIGELEAYGFTFQTRPKRVTFR